MYRKPRLAMRPRDGACGWAYPLLEVEGVMDFRVAAFVR